MSSQAGPSSIPLCTLPRPSKRRRSDAHADDVFEAEDAGSAPSYRLLELPDEIAKMIEDAQAPSEEAEGASGAAEGSGSQRKRSRGRDEGTDHVSHLVINGRHSDEAVLCTSSRTYALRQVTQSNSLLLCSLDSSSSPSSKLTLRSNVTDVLELQPVVPRLERIAELLSSSAYAGESEEKNGRRLYSAREVRSVVQASDDEFKRGLDERCVVELDGRLRLLSPPYLLNLLDSLLLVCSSNAYLPHAVPLKPTVDSLMADYADGARQEIFEAMLTSWFGSDVTTEEPGEAKVALDGHKVSRFIGLELLKQKQTKQKKPALGRSESSSDAISRLPLLDDFIKEWTTRLGDVFATSCDDNDQAYLVNLDLLRGQYLLHADPLSSTASAAAGRSNSSSSTLKSRVPKQRIAFFPSSSLPLEPAARFQALFAARAQWKLEDLLPFVEDVASEKKRREALLLRFARAKKDEKDGVMYYSARVRY